MAICRSYERFNHAKQTGPLCGCNMRLKVGIPSMTCPDNPPQWGPVEVHSGESWPAINNALWLGHRGLPGGTTLPLLLHERCGAPLKLIPGWDVTLDEQQILAWADEYHRRTGRWPTRDSGVIEGAAPRIWRHVDEALRRGLPGLPDGQSLPRFLAAHRGVRRTIYKARLTVEQILGWADAFHTRHGRWPTIGSGNIDEAPSDTWAGVNSALKHGVRGLPKGNGLLGLLAEHRGKRAPGTRLTKAQILAWADDHRQRQGDWPTRRSGPIADVPGETWNGINKSLCNGSRGLARSTLQRLLAAERGVRHPAEPPPLSPKKILTWADGYQCRVGRWPTRASGPVSPGSNETWMAIDSSLRVGARGLVGGSSLSQLLEEERGVLRQQSRPKLSLPQILVWADAFHRREGRWPSQDSGPIAEPGDGTTWRAADLALRKGGRGLKGGSSIAQLLAERRGYRNPAQKKQLSIVTILAWADAHCRRTGKWPTRQSGIIAESPLDAWDRIDNYLRRGQRGLPSGSSLSRLLEERRGVPKGGGRAPDREVNRGENRAE